MVLNTLYQGVNGFQPKAVLAAAVQAVCFINEQHAAQSALDHLVGQRGRVADIAAHQVGTGHFHQLAAAQCADGFQILGQNAGNRGFAGAGVAGKNHVHVHIGNFQALGLALLLGLHVLGNATHKILYFVKAHNGI